MSKYILPLVSNISKTWSKKVDVFGSKFEPNTSKFFYILDRSSKFYVKGMFQSH
jgi:hypothetical protein